LTPNPFGSQIPAEWASCRVTHPEPSVVNELSPKSRLRSMEHEKEHHHSYATERIDERREEHYRSLHATENVNDVGNEIPRQKNRHQYRPDQSQQRRVFECHGRSMNVASDIRNIGSYLGAARHLKGDGQRGVVS